MNESSTPHWFEDSVTAEGSSDGRLHDFVFERFTRRMVCSRCRGRMNQVPEFCIPPRDNPSHQVPPPEFTLAG